jgi:hypothetical protein
LASFIVKLMDGKGLNMKIRRFFLLLALFALVAGLGWPGYTTTQAAPHSPNSLLNFPQDNHQICYAVADSGGGPPGDDLMVQINIDTGLETVVGSPGTFNIEAITFDLSAQIMYAADGDRLGILDLETAAFTPLPEPFGIGRGERGDVLIDDVDGLSFDWITGILYGTHRSDDRTMINDLLIQIDLETGRLIQDAFGEGVDYLIIRAGEVTNRWHIDDIAFDPETNEMYAINNYRGRNDLLVTIDPETGELERIIGGIGIDDGLGLEDMEGLSFDAFGTLIGTTGREGGDYSDHLFWIDKETGQADLMTAIPLTAGSDYEAVDCLAIPPTAVELINFQAASNQDGGIVLTWSTGVEIDHFGFKIYRATSPVFSQAIEIHFEPARQGSLGSEYTYIDNPPASSTGTWYYWLADIDGRGTEHRHGPLQAALSSDLFQVFLPFGLNSSP